MAKNVLNAVDYRDVEEGLLPFAKLQTIPKYRDIEENIADINRLIHSGQLENKGNKIAIIKLFLAGFKLSLSNHLNKKTGAYYFANLYSLFMSEKFRDIADSVRYPLHEPHLYN
jgi:hypothetical protein